jgi:hypothetical protein
MTRTAALAVLCVAVVALMASFARASGDAGAPPETGPSAEQSSEQQIALLRRAESAERASQPVEALRFYRAALAADPGSRLARRARTRIEYLSQRAAGGSEPLAIMMRFRQLPRSELTPTALEAFEHQVDTFPPGPVRRESRETIADLWYYHFKQPIRAVGAFRRWLAEPGLSNAEWVMATTGLALARADLGDVYSSVKALKAAGLGHRTETDFLEVRALRIWALPLALTVIGAFIVFGLVLGGWRGFGLGGLRRALGPSRILLGLYTLGIPYVAAHAHRPITWRTIELLVPLSAALLLLTSIFAAGLADAKGRVGWRRALAVLGVGAQASVCYIAADHAGLLVSLLVSYKLHY